MKINQRIINFLNLIWYHFQANLPLRITLPDSVMSSDNSLQSTTINSIPATPSTLTLVTFPSSLKLTSTNYLPWKAQVEAILQGLDLFKFIDGSYPCPAKPTTTGATTTPNPDYLTWYRQDRLLYGALIGSLSPNIVSLIHNSSSSFDAWTTLTKAFANPSRGHIKQLQHRLKMCTKNPDQPITDFMQSIKSLADELAILGKPVDPEDVTDYVLNGLDADAYKQIIDAVHARDTPISFPELHEKLINHELTLLQQKPAATTLHQPITAFVANTRNHSRPWQPKHHSNQTGLLPTPPQPSSSTRPFLGKCQWCFQKGHSLTSCPSFRRAHPHINPPQYPRNTGHSKPQLNMVGVSSVQQSTPQTPANFDSYWTNSMWDSGASHHLAQDLNAMSLHAPYSGTDELIIGDGPQNQDTTARGSG
ncbi:putative transcription factor interactor and regulator CCHC(Zn) family [Helianthus annuus]|nr:putative transcription factor interactor and regulator CCHC(Zn) family [Helianthus annuus]